MASQETAFVHVLEKSNYHNQIVQSISLTPSTLPPLQPNSLRVRSQLLALTTNNLSYANLGDFLAWWDTYPVPQILPSPYNDSTVYGICPAWGYATVLASTLPSIASGQLIWGYFPLSTLPVDLSFPDSPSPETASGHLIENSPHRSRLMPLYQRNIPASSVDTESTHKMAIDALLRALYGSTHTLNKFVFPPDLKAQSPVHPLGLGAPPGASWTAQDANLSKAIVVSLAASSKTSLCFAHELRRRSPSSGPLASVAVTSSGSVNFVKQTGLYDDVLTYADLGDSALTNLKAAMLSQNPSRVVIANFGGRGSAATDLTSALKSLSLDLLVREIVIAGAPSVLSADQKKAAVGSMASAPKEDGPIRSNASSQRVAAIKGMPGRQGLGEEKYFADFLETWRGFRDGEAIKGMKVWFGEGIAGDNGVVGVWGRLCRGEADPSVGTVVRLG